MIRRLAPLIWFMPLWFLGCATSVEPDATDPAQRVVHVAQVVGNEFFGLGDPERFRHTTFRYDQRFRRPDLPYPTKVDCSTVHNIGVVYLLIVKPRPAYRRRIKIHYTWSHPAIQAHDPDLVHFHSANIPPNFSEVFMDERLFLSDEHKLNGIFKLTATVDGQPILQSSFELLGCPDQDPNST